MKTVLVLLVICGVAACQSYIDFRKPMRLLYGGDTLIISLQGDSVIFSGKAAELVLRDSTLLEIIQAHGGTGGGTVYASNGTYKDGDTIKLGGGTRIKNNTTIGEQSNSIIYYDNQYQKGIMLYVSKNPSGSAQSTSSVQIKSHYNPSILPSEKLDSSTYIQFSSFHSPVGTSGKYAEARFNENGLYYTDTLGGRNANNPRWIPDKAYVDGLCSSGGSAVGDVGDVQFSDGASGFTNSEGISSGSSFLWDGVDFFVAPDDNSQFEFDMTYGSSYWEFNITDGVDVEQNWYMDAGTFYYVNYKDGTLGEIFLQNGGSTTANSKFSVTLSDEKLLEVTYDKGGIKVKQLSGSLTDGTPTAAEITAIVGVSASVAGAGFQVTIKDSDGTGLLYKVESDGTDWYYTAMTKAL